MSKIKFIVPVIALLIFVGTATPAHAKGLTSTQIQAILSLLSSFGADQATINNVNASLGGTGTVPTATTASASAATPSGSTSSSTSASCVTLTRVLSFNQGDATTGGEVSKLQKFLGGQVNGHFGPATVTLVKNWQKAHGITTTGATGPSTRASMSCK